MNYLDKISKKFTTLKGMDMWTNYYEYLTIKKYFLGKNVLELGCADGGMTKLILDDFESITVIDGSEYAINRLKKQTNSNKINTIIGYFEEVQLNEKFDTIIMGHILEHVDDPVYILNKFKVYLKENGNIIITVPNANSFHRIAGVKMGLLKSIYELNETDKRIGHKRVYDFLKIKNDIENSGLKIVKRDGYWLKFLSNKQIEENWDKSLIQTYMELGSEFIDNAAEIVIVCKSKEEC